MSNYYFDNEEIVMKMMEDQGFVKNSEGIFEVPRDGRIKMEISSDLIPICPDDGKKMTTNLRADNSFVEDAGCDKAIADRSICMDEDIAKVLNDLS
ncbi:MAG: hypothetical protein K6G84_13750 [Lachnospiraceae bacterium]|nr:hypothetical protein [Lachnospiraceae bacterium]